MTIKTILPFGDPILRKNAKPIETMNSRMTKLLDDLAETLYDRDGRAGLAAPQVGMLRRLIVMDCGEGLIELIKPEIIEMSGEQTGKEACLSLPGYYGYVTRANYVKVKNLTRQGEPYILEGEGYLARCIQHEIDHLHGVLYVDHVQEGELFYEDTNQPVPVAAMIRLTNQGL